MSAVEAPVPDDPPLAGVRVLDLTRLLPGPVCTLYLADLGADVVKVEDTGAGDYARTLDLPPDAPPGTMSAFFRHVNRNKRSLSLNLKSPAGRDVFARLVGDADIVVESFRPGVAAALGVDATTLLALRPSLVYASISGYGQHGPRAGAAGHDINYLGYAGVLEQTGAAGGAPALGNLQVADLLGGAASAAIAILAALTAAQRTGRGRAIDVAMADAALAHNVFALHALAQHGTTRPRGDDLLTGGVPCYGVYPTADGRYVAVGALEAKFWTLMCRTLGRDDLIGAQLDTGARGAVAREALRTLFASQPLAHWRALFDGVDCCVTPVATLTEALADPQFAARGMVWTRPDGSVTLAPPFAMPGVASRELRPAPAQGEHSAEILRAAGYDDAAIEALRRARVIGSDPAR